MELQVSLEVEPARFDPTSLEQVGGRMVRWHQKGWLSVAVDAQRLHALGGLAGVVAAAPVLACQDRLAELQPPPTWTSLAEADCGGLLKASLEAGRQGSRLVLLRQTMEVLQPCFVRSHRTDAQDILVLQEGPGGSEQVVCRYTDGLRDHSAAGMHDWKQGEAYMVAMWVGHLPAGNYRLRAGIDGWVRVKARPTPFAYEASVRLG